MDWFEQGKIDLSNGMSINDIAVKHNISYKTAESRFYRERKRNKEISTTDNLVKQPANLQESILKELQKGIAISEVCKKYNSSERVVKATIEDIKESGYDVIDNDGYLTINKVAGVKENRYKENWKGEKVLRFGLIGDTHLNSNAQQLTHLNDFYDICVSEGIETIYHDGDLVDGDCVYPGHQFEVFNIGVDKQKNYAIKNYPSRKGITTKFIGGNHDLKWFHKSGIDVCEGIASERKDMFYLGQYAADVTLTPNCKLRLEHPLGKPAYAISYKTQRKIDNMRGGTKPNILSEGHYHYSDYFFRRNVHAVCTPSFQGPTAFSTRLGLENDNGGWIVEINVDSEGTITKFIPSFYPFYKVIEHDY